MSSNLHPYFLHSTKYVSICIVNIVCTSYLDTLLKSVLCPLTPTDAYRPSPALWIPADPAGVCWLHCALWDLFWSPSILAMVGAPWRVGGMDNTCLTQAFHFLQSNPLLAL